MQNLIINYETEIIPAQLNLVPKMFSSLALEER